jgi:hypothetical protein
LGEFKFVVLFQQLLVYNIFTSNIINFSKTNHCKIYWYLTIVLINISTTFQYGKYLIKYKEKYFMIMQCDIFSALAVEQYMCNQLTCGKIDT